VIRRTIAGPGARAARPLSATERGMAIALTGAAIVGTLTFMGRVSVLLCAAMAASCALWLAGRLRARRNTLPIFAAGIAILLLHVAEEYATGFQRAFPGLLGYAWSDRLFLGHNLTWSALFVLAAVGMRRGVVLASLAAGFFAVGAGVANGVGHLLLAAIRWGYFPGLFTGPLCLAAGIALLRSLWRSPAPATEDRA